MKIKNKLHKCVISMSISWSVQLQLSKILFSDRRFVPLISTRHNLESRYHNACSSTEFQTRGRILTLHYHYHLTTGNHWYLSELSHQLTDKVSLSLFRKFVGLLEKNQKLKSNIKRAYNKWSKLLIMVTRVLDQMSNRLSLNIVKR